MTQRPTWSMITVTYNSAADLQHFWTAVDLTDAEWIVVDNASQDGSADVAAHLGARVIRLPHNVGFGAANNAGVREACGAYVAFVNPDVAVDMHDLASLREAVDATGGLVSPQLLNEDGSYQPNGRGLPFLVDKIAHRGLRLPGSRVRRYSLAEDTPGTWICVAWFMGAAVCATRQTFEAIGAWDERFFIYYEDHEIGLRAWRHGVPVVVDRRVAWRHGWRRETSTAARAPWAREWDSARKFYALFPELLLPTRDLARRRHVNAAEALFQEWDPSVTRPEGGRDDG